MELFNCTILLVIIDRKWASLYSSSLRTSAVRWLKPSDWIHAAMLNRRRAPDTQHSVRAQSSVEQRDVPVMMFLVEQAHVMLWHLLHYSDFKRSLRFTESSFIHVQHVLDCLLVVICLCVFRHTCVFTCVYLSSSSRPSFPLCLLSFNVSVTTLVENLLCQ